ncbi:MAG: ABC transporter permease [Bacteroidetes bacterium]|jgi:lipoprotein-releasing system permease protein|nr:ABC transporter permease [Bacteroidota bacterium]
MSNAVLIQIAKTHLLTRKKQSAIASLGVTFGIGTFVVLVSFMTGLNGLLDGLILNRTPHIRIYNEVQPSAKQPIQLRPEFKGAVHMVHSIKPKQEQASIYNNQPLMATLKKNPLVMGVTPQVSARIFYQSGSVLLNGNAIGIDPLEEDRLFNFKQYVVNGLPRDLANNDNGIVLGIGVAKKLSIGIGDRVQLLSSSGATYRLKVVGFFQSGLADIDKLQSYVNVKTAQRIAGEGNNHVTDISVKLHDIEKAKGLSDEIAQTYGVNSIDVKAANAQFETGTTIRNIITYAVSITLLIVAGFGIYNILNMVIYEKMNDIAILKATGFSGSDVKRIFIYQAMFIGVVGGLIGLAMGGLLSFLISKAPFETEAIPTVKTFPVNFQPLFYVIGAVFAIVTTFFAGYLPARKASKIDPVEIIRGQ